MLSLNEHAFCRLTRVKNGFEGKEKKQRVQSWNLSFTFACGYRFQLFHCPKLFFRFIRYSVALDCRTR